MQADAAPRRGLIHVIDVRFWPIPLKNSDLEREHHVTMEPEPGLFDPG